MQLEFLTNSSAQTKKAGAALARVIIKAGFAKKAVFVALIGDLGGGKTSFVQGLAKGLRIRERVNSPTFVIVKKYKIKNLKTRFQYFIHIDCYRIQRSKDLMGLGFKEMAAASRNIVAIEWADKAKSLLPKNALFIRFDFIDKNTRKITLSSE